MRLLRHIYLVGLVAPNVVGEASVFAQSFTPIRVNAGGSAYTDDAGNVWSADTGFSSGSSPWTDSVAIAGTTNDALYQTYRYDQSPSAPDLEYEFTVPNGVYEVNLLLAQTWSPYYSVAAQRFSIQLESMVALPSVDIYAEAGPATALVKTATIGVTDGKLNVHFLRDIQNPIVNAIEIKASLKPSPPINVSIAPFSTTQLDLMWSPSIDDVGVSGYEVERCQGASCTNFSLIAASAAASYKDSGLAAATTYRYRLRAIDQSGNHGDYSAIKNATTQDPTPPATSRINSGGSAYTDSASNLWSADTGFNAGSSWTEGVSIAGTTDDELYQTYRWHTSSSPELEYSLALPPGQYQVRLHFAETWSPYFSVGSRIFHAQIEGVTVFPSIDVFAEAGANTALIKAATTFVADGHINIRLVRSVQNPIVSAIEVLWSPPADNTAPSAPTALSATPTWNGAIHLSWSASTDNVGVAGYEIQRCAETACINFTEIATTSSLGRNDSQLVPNSTYRYRLRAFDASGNRSAYSSVVDVTTSSTSAEYVYDELGRLVLVTVASGASIVYAYDESGNVTAIIRAAP